MTSSECDTLLNDLRCTDEKRAVAAAQALASSGYIESLPDLIDVIRTTESKLVRNAVAIALADLQDDRAVPVLAELLDDPRTKGSRGTLIYALSGFDCGPILERLVDIVVTGNFEERHQAFANIESIESEISTAIWNSCIGKLEIALRQAPRDRRELIADLLELFRESDDSAEP